MSEKRIKDISVGNRIRKIADLFYDKHGDLAELLEMTNGVLSNYVNSKRNPGFVFLQKMLGLGFSATWIIGGEGSMFAENSQGFMLEQRNGHKINKHRSIRSNMIEWIENNFGSIDLMCDKHSSLDREMIKTNLLEGDTRNLLTVIDDLSLLGYSQNSLVKNNLTESSNNINSDEMNDDEEETLMFHLSDITQLVSSIVKKDLMPVIRKEVVKEFKEITNASDMKTYTDHLNQVRSSLSKSLSKLTNPSRSDILSCIDSEMDKFYSKEDDAISDGITIKVLAELLSEKNRADNTDDVKS